VLRREQGPSGPGVGCGLGNPPGTAHHASKGGDFQESRACGGPHPKDDNGASPLGQGGARSSQRLLLGKPNASK